MSKTLAHETRSARETIEKFSDRFRESENNHAEQEQKTMDRCRNLMFENEHLLQKLEKIENDQFQKSNLDQDKIKELRTQLEGATKSVSSLQLEITKLKVCAIVEEDLIQLILCLWFSNIK